MMFVSHRPTTVDLKFDIHPFRVWLTSILQSPTGSDCLDELDKFPHYTATESDL